MYLREYAQMRTKLLAMYVYIYICIYVYNLAEPPIMTWKGHDINVSKIRVKKCKD